MFAAIRENLIALEGKLDSEQRQHVTTPKQPGTPGGLGRCGAPKGQAPGRGERPLRAQHPTAAGMTPAAPPPGAKVRVLEPEWAGR